MKALGISEADFEESFFVPKIGPWKKKKRRSGVSLSCQVASISVTCSGSSSQVMNRFHARRQLVEKLERLRANEVAKEEDTPVPSSESAQEHMARMFGKNFHQDIAQPYALPSAKLLGACEASAKFMRIPAPFPGLEPARPRERHGETRSPRP